MLAPAARQGLVLVALTLPAPPDSDPASEVKALAAFSQAAAEYAALHRKAAATVPPLKAGAEAAEIAAREKALAEAIRALRTGAKPGDLCTGEAKPVLIGIVKGYLSRPEGAPAREKVEKENPRVETPAAPVKVGINVAYEAGASLSTVPAPLLLKLPRLPEELEYRFVGRHLVLRDTTANIIVDFIRDALP